MSPEHLELSHDIALASTSINLGSAPHSPYSPHIELGAIGGVPVDYNETASIMNELPPHCFGR